MCFHTKQSKDAQTLEKRFKATFKETELFQSNVIYNGFAFPKTPVITNINSDLIQQFNWGLFPSWANDGFNKSYTLNAKLETLQEKPSFKNILNNRCLIIVDGFYEWQHIGKSKHKFEIGFDQQLFTLAGLYEQRNDYHSYTIITTEAQGIMREIHNSKLRMPIAFKEDEQMYKWLNKGEIDNSYDFTTHKV